MDPVDNVDPCATDARLLSQLLPTHTLSIATFSHGILVQLYKMTLKLILGHILDKSHNKKDALFIFTFSQSDALNDVSQLE